MKKFLAIILVALAAIFVVPEVQAGDRHCRDGRRFVLYYDHCGRPVYGYIDDDYRHYRPRSRRYYADYYDYSYPRYSYRPRTGFTFYISR
jgi:hypothetical protein